MAAYMRGHFDFLGITTPNRRATSKPVLRQLRDGPDWESVSSCWEAPEREFQYVVCDHLRQVMRPGAVRGVPGHGQTLQPGRVRRLRLCLAFALLLGFAPVPGVHPGGMPVIWGLANPKIGEREMTTVLPDHDRDRVHPGQVIVADKGFAGREFEGFVADELDAVLIRPDRRDEAPRFGSRGGVRQWAESVFDSLEDQSGLEHHRARTCDGVYADVAAKLLALATVIWHNWLVDAPDKRSLPAYDLTINRTQSSRSHCFHQV